MPERTSIWLRPAKPGRGRPVLDRDRIVRAAVSLLDEESVAGLTMRKLADRLGAPPMTLYSYVATKDDLLEYALDAVFAEMLDDVEPGDDWRAALGAIGGRTFDALLRHHWAAALVGAAPPIGPAAVAQFGTILRVLIAAGFSGERLESATTCFYYYVLGAALAESSYAHNGSTAGASIAELSNLTAADGTDIAPTAQFLAGYANADARDRFERGLTAVLDGLRPA
ncbi:TetR/AcrR family transcriptional regulator [Nocardia wallacei]|uniref:TetR family transcriptional regulator n=1 Tax=Nocardia wallacei TaxID=480035 RepID=A0A7G1KLU7_9NOCA|nr:TetR/AcrR family transcriptional regulator [Nocardia wallacei]BCK56162.1 TetR family transcriptional regulator [Nocardia wallacei]